MRLNFKFEQEGSYFASNFGQIQTITEYIGDPYVGEYTVTPTVEEQIMQTKEKIMRDDVTIQAIPYFEVSNTSDGVTVYIANEV